MSNPVSLEGLDFTGLEDQVETLLAEVSQEAEQSGDLEAFESALTQAWADLDAFREILAGPLQHKAVSQVDWLSIESLRHRYDDLDRFLREHPVSLYTAVPTRNQYDASMESWISNAAKAFIAMIKRLYHWIVEQIKLGWSKLGMGSVNLKKVDAKLDALATMERYLAETRGYLNNAPIAGIQGQLKYAREEQLYTLNAKLEGRQVEYLRNPVFYDQLIAALADTVINLLPSITQKADVLILGAGTAETFEDVIGLKQQMAKYLSQRPLPTVLVQLITKQLGGIPDDSRPLELRIAVRLDNSPISNQNSAKAELHPVRFSELLTSGSTLLKPFDRQWINRFDKEFLRLVKTSRDFISQLDGLAPRNQAVADAFVNTNFGQIVAEFQSVFSAYGTLQTFLSGLIQSRSVAVNGIIQASLNEVKAVDAIVESKKAQLTLAAVGRINRLKNDVFSAVRSARI